MQTNPARYSICPACRKYVSSRKHVVIDGYEAYHPECHDLMARADRETLPPEAVPPPSGDMPPVGPVTLTPLQGCHAELVAAGLGWDDASELARILTSRMWSVVSKQGALQGWIDAGLLAMNPGAAARMARRYSDGE